MPDNTRDTWFWWRRADTTERRMDQHELLESDGGSGDSWQFDSESKAEKAPFLPSSTSSTLHSEDERASARSSSDHAGPSSSPPSSVRSKSRSRSPKGRSGRSSRVDSFGHPHSYSSRAYRSQSHSRQQTPSTLQSKRLAPLAPPLEKSISEPSPYLLNIAPTLLPPEYSPLPYSPSNVFPAPLATPLPHSTQTPRQTSFSQFALHQQQHLQQLYQSSRPRWSFRIRLSSRPLSSYLDSQAAWLILYFFCNLSLTLYNKGVLVKFPFPYTLTALHTLCGSIGGHVLLWRGAFEQKRLNQRENLVLVAFSFLYTINIAVSNVSLGLVTVPFHQVVRAATPIFAMIVSAVLLRARFSSKKIISLLPVIAGVGFATYDDYYFTTWGLILTLLGTFLAALKTVFTHVLQSPKPTSMNKPILPSQQSSSSSRQPAFLASAPRLHLHPLDLLTRMSPLAFVQCIFFALISGELQRVRVYSAVSMTTPKFFALLANGILAFGLNIVSFTANKKVGPLSMTVAANVKQVLTIICAVKMFGLRINIVNALGIALTLVGGAWYAGIEYKEKMARKAKSTTS